MGPNHLRIKVWVILAITSIWSIFITGQVYAQGSSGTSPQCPTPPQSILVYLYSFYNEWPSGSSRYQTPGFEDYVWGVVMGELGSVVPQGPYQGQAWHDEVLRAQAVAARTWGAYWCRKRLLPDGRRGVYDGAGDQVYRPMLDFLRLPRPDIRAYPLKQRGCTLAGMDYCYSRPIVEYC
jgi:hypothetical protein